MKMINKMKSLLLIAMITILLLPFEVAAADIEAFYDSVADQYLFYTDNYGEECAYALSADTTPTTFYTCPKDSYGNNVVIVDSASVPTAQYLWTKKGLAGDANLSAVDLGAYYTSDYLSDVDTDFIGSTTKRINVTPGERIITVTDTTFEAYKYVLVKVTTSDYESLYSRATGLQSLNAGVNPFVAMQSMNAFMTSYASLLPPEADARWLDLPADKIIHEPLDTHTGDIYIVWLMGSTLGNPTVYDMQIMYCLRDDIVVPTKTSSIKRLPRTGLDNTLKILLGVNILALPLVYLNKKRLAKAANEVR